MKKLNLLFILTILTKVLWSQTDLLLYRAHECADTNYMPSANDKANYAILDQMLQKMEHPHLINTIRVRECAGLNNCVTQKMNRNNKLVFILYDNAFIDKHKKKVQSDNHRLAAKGEDDKDWVTIGILAHELGHILCRHVDDSTQNDPHQSELQADEWIGVALRKMGASLSQAQQCMQAASIEKKGVHPHRAQRLDAIKFGYYRYDLPKAIRSFHDKDFELAYKILINRDLELNAEGYWCLGQLQEYGRGGAEKDTSDALESYEKAIQEDSNYCAAYTGLARLSKPNKKLVLKWQNKAALHNCLEGLLYMGFEMERSDPVSAAKLYKKATLHGSPRAWHNLGSLYETGKGVAENFQEALKCYQKAASLGLKQSMDYLKDRGLPLK